MRLDRQRAARLYRVLPPKQQEATQEYLFYIYECKYVYFSDQILLVFLVIFFKVKDLLILLFLSQGLRFCTLNLSYPVLTFAKVFFILE